ncbi:unnamed protein product [Larinioides sclopetarius]|uniref:Uncharacterized protein n=1 Tax=Larinioides sclopetarius TaxID=280406 RepID=A0AAV1Z7N2_9ARAC
MQLNPRCPPSPDLTGNSTDSYSRPLSTNLFASKQQIANSEDEGHFSFFFMEVLHSCNEKFGSSKSSLKKITERLKKLSPVGQWEKFLHTTGGSIPMRIRDSCTIRVQPTSIARRAPKITKGSKRLPAGRPPASVVPSKKKKHVVFLKMLIYPFMYTSSIERTRLLLQPLTKTEFLEFNFHFFSSGCL